MYVRSSFREQPQVLRRRFGGQPVKVHMIQGRVGGVMLDIHIGGTPDGTAFPAGEGLNYAAGQDGFSRSQVSVQEKNIPRHDIGGQLAPDGLGLPGRCALPNEP